MSFLDRIQVARSRVARAVTAPRRKPAAADRPVAPAAIAEACEAAGVGYLAASLIKAAPTQAQLDARLAAARGIVKQFAAAAKMDKSIRMAQARGFVLGGASADEVAAVLLEQLVENQSPAIRNSHQSDAPVDPWGDAIRRTNTRAQGS